LLCNAFVSFVGGGSGMVMSRQGPRAAGLVALSFLVLLASCGGGSRSGAIIGSSEPPTTGGGGSTGAPGGSNGQGMGGNAGGAPGGAGGSATGGPVCSDLFAPVLQTFSIDIGASDWAAIQNEFVTAGQLTGQAFTQYQAIEYPVVFHFGNETVSDAYMHLKGDSSWRQTVQFDGANGKMQVGIAFDHINPSASFHGVSKLVFDMPRSDPTFLRERLANAWLREIGVPAICATSGALVVNGNLYGVFVAEENIGHSLVREFFPGNSNGDLFKGGWTAETNKTAPNWTKVDTFWAAKTAADLTAIVDVPNSLLSWAAEALLNDGDGYWGGDHNFYIYDEGAPGYVFFPTDLDASLDYLGQFTSDPIFWWSARSHWTLPIPQHYLIVIGDDGLRAQFIQALATQQKRMDVGQLQGWIDAWSAQIASAVAADPHKATTFKPGDFEAAVALARRGVQERSDYVASWLQCKASGTGEDKDGDGYSWCNDCRDDDATMHPGAPEICGNQIDDNCNGVIDEGCPATTPGP